MTVDELTEIINTTGMMPTSSASRSSNNVIYTGAKGAQAFSAALNATLTPVPKKTKAEKMKEDPMLAPIPVYPEVREVWYKQEDWKGKRIQCLKLDSAVPCRGEDGKTYYGHVYADIDINTRSIVKDKPGEVQKRIVTNTRRFHAQAFRESQHIVQKEDLEGASLVGSRESFLQSKYQEDPTYFSRQLG